MALKKKSEETNTTAPAADEKEVATRQSTAVSTDAGGSVFVTNSALVEAVHDAEWGTFPSVVASNGTHMCGEDDLGKILQFQAIVAKDVWKMTPGSNDEEAKEFFTVSYDGPEELEEAKQEAIASGYDKAAIKKYIDIIAIITDCDNAAYVGETITLQLAPSSQFTWKPLAGKLKMMAALGKLKAMPIMGDPDLGTAVVFQSTANPKKWKGNSYTAFDFEVAK
jgi:hypothetical protein